MNCLGSANALLNYNVTGNGGRECDRKVEKISKDDIKIGDNSFKDGQILNIDVDIKIRGTADGDTPISETIQDILKIYPGIIQGKMKQIASITKRGFKEY